MSQMTWKPASSAAMAGAAWRWLGVMVLIAARFRRDQALPVGTAAIRGDVAFNGALCRPLCH
ncbi:hypothetical protein [Sphingobium sp. AP50]|uniref:hypothetical protein n=1 Tax=Sphingobium sp. AP50 TaxID=1884369 RepID=UPI0015A71226|nr:hypothetical protein [Sphingobium sp. AP50]